MANTNTTTAVATVGCVWAPAVDGTLISAPTMEQLRKKLAEYNQDYYSNR